MQYLRPYVPRMSLGLVVKFLGTVIDLLIPWLLVHLVDDVVPLGDRGRIFAYGGLMLLCAAAALVTNIAANRMASHVARDAIEVIRHDLFAKISYLSCRQVDEFTIPSLESRLTSDTYNLHQMISRMQRLGIRAPILLLGGICITLTLDAVLTLVLVSVLPLIAIVVYVVSHKGIPLYTKLQQSVDRMVRTVRENATGVRVIKALSKGEYEKERFDAVNKEVVANETKAAVTMALSNPTMNLLLNLGLTLVILVGAWRVGMGAMLPGKIMGFLTYFTIILNAMLSVTKMFVLYSKGSASAERISQVLEAGQDLQLAPPDHVQSEYHVEFSHVSFSYNKKRENLSDISFALRKGETLGIIGPTGCGKSTVLNLLIRFYDPDSGTIRIGGDNVKSIPFAELHTKFGIAFQNDALFAETIAENIDFGRELSAADIARAALYAQARPFIEELEEGYDYGLTSKGTNLSGGQKQRLLISRALAAEPEILILDDSSSALDYETDARLRTAIREHYQNTTTILVAQRVSSIQHADHILVLEEGRAIGYGTHEQLLQSCPAYREISRVQMGGERHAS